MMSRSPSMIFINNKTISACFTSSIILFFLPALCEAQAPQVEWWYDLNAPSLGSAATADIDNDGKLEIVFGAYFNDECVHALNAEDGSLLWKYDTGGCNDASPVIADVDMDGQLEVILPSSSPQILYCFNGKTGKVEWSKPMGYCMDSPPAIADMDKDGKPEIVLGTFNGNVFCLNGENGSQVWKKNLGTNSYIQSGPNILDINGNGNLEVIVAQWLGDTRIYALDGNNGSVLWYSDEPTDHMYHGGAFADIDADGKPELTIGCYDGMVYSLNCEDGGLKWKYPNTYYCGAPTSIADLDNDHLLEIVYVSYNKVGVLSNSGKHKWSYTTGGNSFRGAAISDIDGNGVLDLVFGSDDGILRVLHGDTGKAIWTFNLKNHYGKQYEIDHAPIVADFNNDGKLDVFVVGGYATSSNPTLNHGRAYMLSAGNGDGPGWPMFRHDIRHSGCYDGYLPLEASINALSALSGGAVEFTLKGRSINNGRKYILMGTISGSQPGVTLPGGVVTLPINWDLFTNFVISMINSPLFDNFMGSLNANGASAASLHSGGPIIPAAIGATMNFAFALNMPWDMASNSVCVEIVP